MIHLKTGTIHRKSILLIACAILFSVAAHCQTEETKKALQVATEPDENNTDTTTTDQCCIIKKNNYCRFLYVDGGGSDIMSMANGSYNANGLAWAVGAQEAYKIHSDNKNIKMLISAGLEIRNYNGIATSTDRFGASAYDNLHYWYGGIPVIFQFLHSKYVPGKKNGWGCYGLAGITLGIKLDVNDVYSDQGVSTTYDISRHYTTFTAQPFLSGGATYKTPRCTYMLGPFVGYTSNNLVSNTGISEYILSYGLKFTTLFLHN